MNVMHRVSCPMGSARRTSAIIPKMFCSHIGSMSSTANSIIGVNWSMWIYLEIFYVNGCDMPVVILGWLLSSLRITKLEENMILPQMNFVFFHFSDVQQETEANYPTFRIMNRCTHAHTRPRSTSHCHIEHCFAFNNKRRRRTWCK